MKQYYYQVNIWMFCNGHPPFEHTETFKGDNILDCRNQAIGYYLMQKMVITERGHFFGGPFSKPPYYIPGENAGWTIDLLFMEYNPENDAEWYFILAGVADAEECEESLEEERDILEREFGISFIPPSPLFASRNICPI